MSLFGSSAYDVNQERPDDVPFEEQLRGLEAVIKAGKVTPDPCEVVPLAEHVLLCSATSRMLTKTQTRLVRCNSYEPCMPRVYIAVLSSITILGSIITYHSDDCAVSHFLCGCR